MAQRSHFLALPRFEGLAPWIGRVVKRLGKDRLDNDG